MDEIVQKAMERLKEERIIMENGGEVEKERIIIPLEGKEAVVFRFLMALADEDKKVTMIKDMFKIGMHRLLTEILLLKHINNTGGFGLF